MRTISNIALIIPPASDKYSRDLCSDMRLLPMGTLAIASYLEHIGYNVSIIDMQIKESLLSIIDKLTASNVNIVGFTTYAENYENTKSLSSFIKKTIPDVITIAGGPMASLMPHDMLTDMPSLDYIVRNEGEYTLAELLECLTGISDYSLRNIFGVSYRDQITGEIISTPKRDAIGNLDSLPDMNYGLLDMEPYGSNFSILTSRGCPGECTFCTAKAMHGNFRFRSIDRVIQEIYSLKLKYDMVGFNIVDDAFTANPKRVFQFCEALIKSNSSFVWTCQSRADVITREMASIMKQSGCKVVQLGLESADNNILKKLRKGITVEQVVEAVKHLHSQGLKISLSFIFGHPWDTLNSMNKLIDFVEEMIKQYGIIPGMGVNTPFPGSWQYENSEKLSMKIHSKKWDDYTMRNVVISTDNFTCDQLREIFYYANEKLKPAQKHF